MTVEELYAITGSYNAHNIIEKLGIIVTEVSFSVLNELAICDPQQGLIFIRNDLSNNLHEFALDHEIGHIVMHNDIQSPLYMSGNKSKIEKQANDFAIELVAKNHKIPEEQVVKYLNDTFPFLKLNNKKTRCVNNVSENVI
ncbi:ImmA/IrrE family metallo-endopeptidase [Culicoidibacter larvae]|nr:ImmA/IrrE family metallo-endopeptidase [Culicoidibacter larvae]